MYFTSLEHKETFYRLFTKHGVENDRERIVLLYCLTATEGLRTHINDTILIDEIGKPYPDISSLNAEWPCSSARVMIGMAINLFCGSDTGISMHDIVYRLGDDLFKVAIQALKSLHKAE